MEQVTKDSLLARIHADRAAFDAIVDSVPTDRLAEPALPGGWSVKDVLAHIPWGEREGIGVVRRRALVGGSPLWDVSEDERNAEVVAESRSRDLDAVVADYRATFTEYVDAIGDLSDDELNDPQRILGLPERIPGWPPWRVVYDPGHYEEHGRAIEAAFPAKSTSTDGD